MSREIKFRALKDDMSNCKFVYGDYIDSCSGYPKITNNAGETFHSCLNGTLGQFTRLTDKNGKEIYEGDLMKDNEGCIFRIYHVYGGFVIKAAYWAKDIKDLIPADELIFEPLSNPQTAQWIQSSCEVIGNIHEDKHLLK